MFLALPFFNISGLDSISALPPKYIMSRNSKKVLVSYLNSRNKSIFPLLLLHFLYCILAYYYRTHFPVNIGWEPTATTKHCHITHLPQ